MAKIFSYQITSQAFDLYGSRHHQYSLITSKPYARYAKTTVGGIAFRRLDPSDYSKVIDGLLISKEENLDPISKVWFFDLNSDVIYVYSASEDLYFRNQNAILLSTGKLIPISDDVADVGQAVRADVDRIINLPIDQFLGAIQTSYDKVLLLRIQAGLTKSHSVEQHEAVKNRLDVLNS